MSKEKKKTHNPLKKMLHRAPDTLQYIKKHLKMYLDIHLIFKKHIITSGFKSEQDRHIDCMCICKFFIFPLVFQYSLCLQCTHLASGNTRRQTAQPLQVSNSRGLSVLDKDCVAHASSNMDISSFCFPAPKGQPIQGENPQTWHT